MHFIKIYPRILLSLTFLLFTNALFGQNQSERNRTFLTLETGPKFEHISFEEGAEDYYVQFGYSLPYASLLVGRELLDQRLLLEGGVSVVVYSQRLPWIYGKNGIRGTSMAFTMQAPVKLSYNLALPVEGLTFSPGIGYSLGFNVDYADGPSVLTGSGGSMIQGTDTTNFFIRYDNDLRKIFHVVSGFANLNYNFKSGHAIYAGFGHHVGLGKLMDLRITESYDPEDMVTKYTGEFRAKHTSAQIGFRLLLNKSGFRNS